MNIKKNVLRISSLYIFYSTALLFISVVCDGSNWCNIREDGIFGLILFTFAPLAFLFLLSLITYRMKDEVFRAWWRFARWWVPVIIAVTLYIGSIGSEGKYPGANGASLSVYYIYQSQFIIYTFLYTILIITSLIKIFNEYFKTKEHTGFVK